MSTTANPITVNADLAKAVQDATSPEAIRAAVLAEATKQAAETQAGVDKLAADAAAKTAADAAAAKAAADAQAAAGFSRTVTINGQDFTFTESTELQLERAINAAYTVANAFQKTETVTVEDPTAKAAADAKAAEDALVARTELDLKFKRGELSPREYLEQSGAMKDYLAEQGIPLDELKAAVERNREASLTQSWEQATEAFRNSAAGADWPGGGQNLEIIGLKLQALQLVDAQDKVAALAQAWQSMKESKMYFPYQAASAGDAAAAKAATDAAAAKATADAAAAATRATGATTIAPGATTAAPAAPKTAQTSSAFFGASSGTFGGGNEGVSKVAPTGDVKIDANASPEAILAEWKRQQIAAGQDPNAAFTETFRTRRA
jgi:trimeric autotransporter adhesin